MKKLTTICFTLALALSLGTGCSDDDGNGNDIDAMNPPDVDAMEPDPYVFRDDAPGAYNRVDRMGMPAVATALITNKDDYNMADPADDADPANPFAAEIVASVEAIHAALDDDLLTAGLTSCSILDSCVEFAGPLVIPDVIGVDIGQAAGFPNGRKLADQAMDITLAVVLLEIQAGTHEPGTLAELPLNPTENDVDFQADFPYLAPLHQ